MKINHKELAIFLLIIFLSIFFRFYNFRSLFQFSFDEEVWSYRIQRIITFKDYRLIGSEISSTGLFTAPLFIYFHVPLYILGNLDPLVSGYFWGGVGVITTLLIYFFTKKYFSKFAAQIASILYASSFMMALHDRRFWNVSPIPIVSVLSAWLLHLALENKKYALIMLSLVLTFGFNSHSSTVPIFLGVVVSWLVHKRKKVISPLQKREMVIAVSLFLLLNFVPQVLFDFRHDFWHVKALRNTFISFSQPKKTESNADLLGVTTKFTHSMGSLIYLGENIDVANEMSHCQPLIDARPKPPTWAIIIGIFLITWLVAYSIINRHKPLSTFLLVLVTINLLGLFIYRERVFTYHFAPIMPFIFVFAGVLLGKLQHKIPQIVPFLLLVAFVFINSKSLLSASSEVSYLTKKTVVNEIIQQTKDKNISVDFLPSCEIYGFRYLFTSQKKPVAKSWEDQALGWLFKEELSQDFDMHVTVAVPDAGNSPDYNHLLFQSQKESDHFTSIGKIKIFFSSLLPNTGSNTTVY